jgi:hypothetical protein
MPSAKEYHCGNAIYKVPDLPSAKLFYSTAFGAEAWFEEPAWVIFQIHEQQLWIVPVDSTEEHPEALGFSSGQGGITDWIVDDVSFVYRRFAELGGSLMKSAKQTLLSRTPLLRTRGEINWDWSQGLMVKGDTPVVFNLPRQLTVAVFLVLPSR